MKLRSVAIAALVAGLAVTPSAQSASLTGDNLVRAVFGLTNGGVISDSSGSVVNGNDVFHFGVIALDFNDGIDEDIFSLDVAGDFNTWFGSTIFRITLTLSDLNFDEPLDSITFLNNPVNASITDQTATSISLVWDDQPIIRGEQLSFRFNSAPVTAVPLPAALPMLAGALGALGLVARRRRA